MHSQNPEDIAPLISKWGMSLQPHSEGGWYCDTYRNNHRYYQRATNVVGAVTGLALQLEEATATEAKGDQIEALIKRWNFATSPRENGGWIAKGWHNTHCYSESRDTLTEAVNGLVAQIEADTKERTLSARGAGVAVARWAFDGAKSDTPTEWPDDLNQPAPVAEANLPTTLTDVVGASPAKPWTGVVVVALPSVYLVECSLDVTGNSVRIFDPTPTAMQALTLACINAEREPVLVIDGKGLPAFARICKVECNHLVGLAPPQCTLTLMGGSVT